MRAEVLDALKSHAVELVEYPVEPAAEESERSTFRLTPSHQRLRGADRRRVWDPSRQSKIELTETNSARRARAR